MKIGKARSVRTQDGRVFSGTDLMIVGDMKDLAFLVKMSMDDYIQWVANGCHQQTGVMPEIVGDSVAERCESLVDALVANGLLTVID